MKEVRNVLTTSKLEGIYNLIVNKNINYNEILGN